MDDEEQIHITGYVDRVLGEGIRQKGFHTLFKSLKKTEKIICYLPINGTKTTTDAWEDFYRRNRSGRTAGERGTKLNLYAYYQFLKKEPLQKGSYLYYYAIPKGFTQTDLLNAESDYSIMIGKGGTLYSFQVESKLSKKVGLCTLRPKA